MAEHIVGSCTKKWKIKCQQIQEHIIVMNADPTPVKMESASQ